MDRTKKPKPEKKLLNEIAHLTNLLQGSKLKPSHQRKTTGTTTATTSYGGKRTMTYRTNQPYFIKWNGGGVGGSSKSKSSLVISSSSSSSKNLRSRYRSWKHFPPNSPKMIKVSSKKKYGNSITKSAKINLKNPTGRFSSYNKYPSPPIISASTRPQTTTTTTTKDVVASTQPIAVVQPQTKMTTKLQTTKETEKSNRYYEIQPKSSPIQTIVQRRVHPDSVSIRCRRNDNEFAAAENDNVHKVTTVQSKLQLPTDDDDNDLSSQCDDEEMIIGNSQDETFDNTELLDSWLPSSTSDKNLPESATVEVQHISDDSQSLSVPGGAGIISNAIQVKNNNAPIGLSSNSTKCSGEDVVNDQRVLKVGKVSMSTNSSSNSSNIIVQNNNNLVNRNIEEENVTIDTLSTMKGAQDLDNNSTTTTTTKDQEGGDSRRLRLMSKLSKLNSFKQRFDQGESQMPSYLPC